METTQVLCCSMRKSNEHNYFNFRLFIGAPDKCFSLQSTTFTIFFFISSEFDVEFEIYTNSAPNCVCVRVSCIHTAALSALKAQQKFIFLRVTFVYGYKRLNVPPTAATTTTLRKISRQEEQKLLLRIQSREQK